MFLKDYSMICGRGLMDEIDAAQCSARKVEGVKLNVA